MIVHALLEGYLEEAVAKRILTYCGHNIGYVYGKKGASYIKNNIQKYYSLTKTSPLLVLSDFIDSGYECPPIAKQFYLGPLLEQQSINLIFRFAVNEIEAWLLADRSGAASFLGVPKRKIVMNPEILNDAKQEVINLARKSIKQKILNTIVPYHGGKVGPEYLTMLKEFTLNKWNIDEAREVSPSLNNCIINLEQIN